MNKLIDTNHKVIPKPEPGIACGKADNGGYTVQPPDAGPVSIPKEIIITVHEAKKNQNHNIFKNPDAISRAPHCNGINRLLNVPLKPPVNTKNTITVPCMVT